MHGGAGGGVGGPLPGEPKDPWEVSSASNRSTYDIWHLIRGLYVAIFKKLSSK